MIRKSAAMLWSTSLLWLSLNSYFALRYVEILYAPKAWPGKLAAGGIVAWILIASFYACFHTMSFVYSLLVRHFAAPVPRNYQARPRIAIFYTVCDDLQLSAVQSCIDQDYAGDFHVFILDDSHTAKERVRVDEVCAAHPTRVSCLRRHTRAGFKAGNINAALAQIGDEYAYVAIADADELLPPNFLTELVAIAEADPSLGFVQAAHRMYGRSAFGRQAGDGIDLHWSHFLPARHRFGFVYFFGHGALLRTHAIEKAGGFPELVSEDLALAMVMAQVGYRGYFASDVVCHEEVPTTFAAYRTRHTKVIRGTLELVTKAFPAFLKSRKVDWVQKLDLAIATAGLYLPIPFLGFCALLHLVMPFFLTDTYSIALRSAPDSGFGYILTAAGLFRPLWGWQALLFTAFTVFAPLCYVLPDLMRSPRKVLGYVFRITPVSLSTVPLTLLQSIDWLRTRRTVFDNTGRRAKNPAHKPMRTTQVETLIGAILTVSAIITGSLFLLAFGLSVLMIPWLLHTNGQGRVSRWLLPVPLVLTLLAFVSVPALLLGFSGAFIGVALAHH